MFNKKNAKVNFDEIKNIYKDATPKYTADILMNWIDNLEVECDESTSS